jgi:hypothetical protein
MFPSKSLVRATMPSSPSSGKKSSFAGVRTPLLTNPLFFQNSLTASSELALNVIFAGLIPCG